MEKGLNYSPTIIHFHLRKLSIHLFNLEKIIFQKNDFSSIKIHNGEVISIHEDSRLYELGIREHSQIESVNDVKVSNEELIEIMTTNDSCTLEVQVILICHVVEFFILRFNLYLNERFGSDDAKCIMTNLGINKLCASNFP